MNSKKTLLVILVGYLLMFVGGCGGGAIDTTLSEQIQKLREENRQLSDRIEKTQAENEGLNGQIRILAGLQAGEGFINLYNLQKIKIGGYTGFFDNDKDGIKEILNIYIQPIDEENDIVKATGAVDVQLWDLNRTDGEALLGSWHIKPIELKKMWFATFITINYRLTFDVTDKIKEIESAEGGLTVKVTFTDYMTGKVFTEQKVIKSD